MQQACTPGLAPQPWFLAQLGLTLDNSGHNIARMRYEIVLAPDAVEDLLVLKANLRAEVKAAMEQHLRNQPEKTSKSRIKRLRGFSRPQYRLRVGDVRVFYDVLKDAVEILAIIPKKDAYEWLEQEGERDERDSPQ